jgi:hypothetical protein
MLNADGQSQISDRSLPKKQAASNSQNRLLRHWLHQAIGQDYAQIKLQLRGNTLHILCESAPCLEAEAVVSKLQHAIANTSLEKILPSDPPVYRFVVYGRGAGQAKPTWTKAIQLGEGSKQQAASSKQQVDETGSSRDQSKPHPSPSAAPSLELAKTGEPTAIARYLSEALSATGVSIRAKVETSSKAGSEHRSLSRLLIACESVYTPDATLLADPIAHHLRELELTGFRDALVFGQVRGETHPEWKLRIDLTPLEDILKEWGRWGDVQAITQLLNRALQPNHIQLSALLKETTLHLSCFKTSNGLPSQETAIAVITPWLQTLSPQGIQSAAIYGVTHAQGKGAPMWVHWLDLPAKAHPELAEPTLELAQAGNLEALTFLLTRLLNPDLQSKLSTGGIRVQIRQKGDLLHIMTDAPNCPRQQAIVTELVRFLKPLHIASISGLRVYGRRAGQKQPLWNYGVDFASRNQRLVPEATPEFAASDTHVDDLLSPAGAIVPWTESQADDPPTSLQRGLGIFFNRVQRSLVRTQLFIPTETTPEPVQSTVADQRMAAQSAPQQAGIALIWSAIGLVMVLQADWVVGQWLHVTTPPRSPAAIAQTTGQTTGQPNPSNQPTASPFPNVALNQPKAHDWQNPETTKFTQPGTTDLSSSPSPNAGEAAALAAAPLQPKAKPDSTDYPTFNSRQLDNQIAVYRQYLDQNGAPDVLVVGSSRALRGIDPTALKAALTEQGYAGVKVFNFGINGATAKVVDWLLRDVLPQDKLPKLILFADGARAFNSGRQDITYNGLTASEGYRMLVAGKPPIPGAFAPGDTAQPKSQTGQADANADSPIATGYERANAILTDRLATLSSLYGQRDRLKTKLLEGFSAALPTGLNSSAVIASSDSLLNSSSPSAAAATGADSLAIEGKGLVDINGFLPLNLRFNPITYYQKYARVSGDYDSDYESFTLQGAQIEALISIAEFSNQRKIPLVFVNLPLTKEYLDPTRKRHEEAFQQQILQLASQKSFIYRDLSGSLTTQPEYFSDPSHLNRYGAYNVSHRIAQDVMIPWQMTR